MADSQTALNETDAYNAGYNQQNDPQLLATGLYDPPLAYVQQQSGAHPQSEDQQPQSGTQPQSENQQPQSGTHPQSVDQQPQKGTQPQTPDQQTTNYGQQPSNYRQQPQYYGQQFPNYGQQLQPNGLQQQVYGQGQSYMGQAPTIQQPMNIRSDYTGSGCSDLLCPAFFVCLCCFCPTGFAAIIYASKATEAYTDGNIADGKRYHSITWTLIKVSVVVGMLFGAIYGSLRLIYRQ